MPRLHQWAATQPNKLAIQMADGPALSYEELDARANRVANWLLSLGLPEGASVALLLENRLETFELWWGARRAGVYYVPVSTHLKPAEVAYLLRDSGASVLVTSDCLAEVAQGVLALLEDGEVRHRYAMGGELAGFARYEPAIAAASASADLPPRSQGREFMYSSGTTGFPKGIKRALAPYARRMDLPELERQLRTMFQLDAETVYISPSPLYHATGRFVIRVIETGGTAVILPKFDAEGALAAMARYRVTHGHWVPTMFIRMLALDPQVRASYDLSCVRVALHATAPCPPKVKQAMIDWWGPVINEYYGGSENVGVTYINGPDWLRHPGSVGVPITGEVHITSEDDPERELPPGEIGLIYFSGGVGFEYHRDATKTRGAFNGRGWGTYGDLGHVDGDGFLFISDRRTDLVISGGVNIYPQEVENALLDHEAVADAAVIGVPHAEFGQEVKAVVQLKPHCAASPQLAGELVEWCRGRLSRIKSPRTVDFVAEVPRSDNGKLLRRVLRDRYAQQAAVATAA
ncbi:AMP-binding protein [Ramlibacter sp. G-1-2-2]|uniref:AMP-binding protein n=1 Tax=Ramlibacter agri TaxID=2728837 RepID=A0A848H3W0_9BURK|nr:AMP-binding protein [Ramlibacter agri]NML43333.1 AMP-binding protein [Ramlibacter agri]